MRYRFHKFSILRRFCASQSSQGILHRILTRNGESISMIAQGTRDQPSRYFYQDLHDRTALLASKMSTFVSGAQNLTAVARDSSPTVRAIAGYVPASIDYTATLLGSWSVGCAYLPFYTSQTAEEIEYCLMDSKPLCLVTTKEYHDKITAIANKCNIPVIVCDENDGTVCSSSVSSRDTSEKSPLSSLFNAFTSKITALKTYV